MRRRNFDISRLRYFDTFCAVEISIFRDFDISTDSAAQNYSMSLTGRKPWP